MIRLFTLFFSVVFLQLASQTTTPNFTVKGQIVESVSGKSIPYATVILKNDSIKVKRKQAGDASGNFSFTVNVPQKYTLTITAFGHQEFSMTVDVFQPLTDLGKVSVEEGIELKEVTVSDQKPLVKIDLDKIVYNMESDPEAQTNNTLEMLKKVPLVTVDAEDNITVNGQSNFKVLINGKSSSMMSNNFKDVLKSLPANTIKNIDVITNPSSKYDAEGVGGIINIITSKKAISGYNGKISAGVDSRGGYNGSAYLAAKIDKFSLGIHYYGNLYKQPDQHSNSESEFFNNTDYHYSKTNINSSYNGLSHSFSGEASYDIDSLNLISLSFMGYQGSYKNEGFSETHYMNTINDITRKYSSATDSKNSYGSLSGNIDYEKTYKKPDKSLTFSYQLENDPDITRSNTIINGITNYVSYHQQSENEALGREQTFQADYYDPVTEMHQIEGGIKYILRQNTSNSVIYRNDTLRANSGNDLDYDQHIFGSYAGYVFKLKKFSAKSGLRLERTWNDGRYKTSDTYTDFSNKLFNLVPYITLSYMPKQEQTLRFSYTQRLSRPGIWYLNPYVNDEDSMNIQYGNPFLKSEISHSIESSYSYFSSKINFSGSAFTSFVNNSIERISMVQTSGATVTTYENIGKDLRYGINLYTNYRPSSKINIYFNGGINYAKLEAVKEYTISNEGFNYRTSLGARWTIWKDGSVSTGFGLYSHGVMLQSKSSAYYYLNFSVSQYLLKRKMMISLSTTDPFWHTKKYIYDSMDKTFSSHYESFRPAQTVRFSVSFNFGKMDMEVKKARRGIQNDDVKDGGNNQGGGQ